MSLLDEARKEINIVDEEMAKLFERRMNAVKKVVAYKKDQGLPILDSSREAFLLEHNCGFLQSGEFLESYRSFFAGVLTVSKDYQRSLLED